MHVLQRYKMPILIFFKQYNPSQMKRTISPINTQCEPRKLGNLETQLSSQICCSLSNSCHIMWKISFWLYSSASTFLALVNQVVDPSWNWRYKTEGVEDKIQVQDSQTTGKLIQTTQSQTVKSVTVNSNTTLKVEVPEGYTGKPLAQFNCLVIHLAIYPDSTVY